MAQADVGSLVEGGEVQRGEGGTAHCSVVLGTASNTAVRQGMSEGCSVTTRYSGTVTAVGAPRYRRRSVAN